VHKFLLSASILSADFGYLAKQIEEVEQANVDWIHVDVMDGHFVPNIKMGPFIVSTIREHTSLPLDIHLMIENPEKYIEAFQEAGASRISIHVEKNPYIQQTIQKIRQIGCQPGIVINPETSWNSVVPFLGMVDLVLIMSVHPGFSGQKFISSTISKIRELKNYLDSNYKKVLIEVDGGITPKNINSIIKAGADVIVAATSIFTYINGIVEGVRSLRIAGD
jgi:ribulose-phosphate 3-epimerase